jgi:lipid A 4'-phosphatase
MMQQGSVQISYHTLWAVVLLAAVSAVFYYFPGIDLWAARKLYVGQGKFLLSDSWLAWIFHSPVDMILKIGFLFGLIVYLIILIFKIKISKDFHKKLIFIFTSAFVSELFIINFILKNHWGRARPVHLPEFGGGFGAHLTPAWQFSHECLQNCSFSSGHAGIAACLGLLAVLLPVRLRPVYLALVVVFTGVVGFMRMARGAHFLSDVVISPLIVLATAMVVKDVLRLKR